MTGRAFPVVWSLRGILGVGRDRYRVREGMGMPNRGNIMSKGF